MEAFFEAVLKNGNAISVVTVILLGSGLFIWAITTERLFTGGRGKEMQKTIAEQATALTEVNKELRETERELDRLTILNELRKERETEWQSKPDPSTRKRG